MTTAQMNAVLMYIANATRDTAPVDLSIGYVDAANVCRHDGIRITKAPEAIVTGVIERVKRMRDQPGERFVSVSIHNGALHIS